MLPHAYRRPESIPSEPALRRRCVEGLIAEIRDRELSGERLRQFVWNVRARAGTDVALDLCLRLIERPS